MSPRAFLHPFSAPSRSSFVSIARGEGAVVWDDRGKAYLDAMASLWYCNVGHGHPRVIAAIRAQLERLEAYQCFAPFTNAPAEDLADAIAARAPLDDPRVFFTCSGSEAVDAAIKLARIAHERAGEPQRDLVISRTQGYHGVTLGGTSAQGIEANRTGFGPLLPGFHQAPQADLGAVAALFEAHAGRVAAVLSEPLQAAGGVHPPPPGYLAGLRDLCDAHGAFLVVDEVVCGFGRLGRWFASEHYGVRPDLITFAKAVTSGYVPLGGVILGPALRERLEADPDWELRHGHTYSGHPTACAAGLACLEVTESEGLLARAAPLGRRIASGLGALVERGQIAGFRGDGAVWAAVLADERAARVARDRLLELGVIVRPLGSALGLCPPLVITDAQVDELLAALDTATRR